MFGAQQTPQRGGDLCYLVELLDQLRKALGFSDGFFDPCQPPSRLCLRLRERLEDGDDVTSDQQVELVARIDQSLGLRLCRLPVGSCLLGRGLGRDVLEGDGRRSPLGERLPIGQEFGVGGSRRVDGNYRVALSTVRNLQRLGLGTQLLELSELRPDGGRPFVLVLACNSQSFELLLGRGD